MSTPRARYIPQLLDTHAEDLAFLWAQRRLVLDSPEHTLRDFAHLGERIEAHVQGLLVAPPAALRQRLDAALGGGERDDIFAAAFAVLRCEDVAVARSVLADFAHAAGPALDGLRDALGQAPAALVGNGLRQSLAQGKPATAAAAAAALANLRLLDPESPGLAPLLLDDDDAVCTLGWRAAARADCLGTSSPPVARPHREALARPAAAVRHAAWAHAAWLGQTALLPHLRRCVTESDAVATHWLCVLGAADDSKLLGAAVMALPEPSQRCAALARFGHPAALPTLVRWMEGEEADLVHAAGQAFMRITGTDIQGERKQLPAPDGADDFDREMAPLVWMPDAAKARQLLEQRGPEWNAGTRWCMGRRMDVEIGSEALATLDLQARWDAAARAALGGRVLSAPPPIVA